jgi:hypothetical protein
MDFKYGSQQRCVQKSCQISHQVALVLLWVDEMPAAETVLIRLSLSLIVVFRVDGQVSSRAV